MVLETQCVSKRLTNLKKVKINLNMKSNLDYILMSIKAKQFKKSKRKSKLEYKAQLGLHTRIPVL